MRGRGWRGRWWWGFVGLLGLGFVAVVVVVVVAAGLAVGRRGWLLLPRVGRFGRRRCLWVVLLGQKRVLVLCRTDFAVLRLVKVGRKQIEKGR